ncbi:putative molybdenum transport protein [Methylococcus capsulatus str. Bath]|uniref:Putative molybdenum transport protein n=1 Tax=Methylococcus capsulatus (strain ATCC 33009 / NCIMB 11132 / Bath) TaxID=243233 RepID=Q608Z2_METCA|nr:putative molybdenum transport protein [Methylococcus capsulatus str. Bath]
MSSDKPLLSEPGTTSPVPRTGVGRVGEKTQETHKRRTKKTVHPRRCFVEPRFKLTLRLLYGTEIAFGPGKAELLEAIEQTGSISAAGRSMDMSYRRAWLLVDTMNRSFREPVVDASRGGRHGGGAHLTPFGRDVLERYREVQGALQQVADTYLRLFRPCMATTPPIGDPAEIPHPDS